MSEGNYSNWLSSVHLHVLHWWTVIQSFFESVSSFLPYFFLSLFLFFFFHSNDSIIFYFKRLWLYNNIRTWSIDPMTSLKIVWLIFFFFFLNVRRSLIREAKIDFKTVNRKKLGITRNTRGFSFNSYANSTSFSSYFTLTYLMIRLYRQISFWSIKEIEQWLSTNMWIAKWFFFFIVWSMIFSIFFFILIIKIFV